MAPKSIKTETPAPAGAIRTKTQPNANKVNKPSALKAAKKKLFEKVVAHKFSDVPKPKFVQKSRYATKAVDRLSGKAIHYRKKYPERFYDAWPNNDEKCTAQVEKGKNHWLSLSPELRARLFRMLVVDENNFTWPNSETGKMQPDIARVCKLFRREVLPIYYQENTFAFDLEYSVTTPGSTMSPIVAFASGLHRNLLKQVKKWAFAIDIDVRPAEEAETQKPSWQTVLYKFELPRRKDDCPTIGIHRDVACLMDKTARPCILQANPAEFLEGVIEALWEGERNTLTPKVLLNLTAYLEGAAVKMLDFRCDREERASHDRLVCARLDEDNHVLPDTDISQTARLVGLKTCNSPVQESIEMDDISAVDVAGTEPRENNEVDTIAQHDQSSGEGGSSND